ncbi:hypothetical protein BYZ73_21455, partial [Rhodovulum viride]
MGILQWEITETCCRAQAPFSGFFSVERWHMGSPWRSYFYFVGERERFARGPNAGGFYTAEEAMAAVDAKVLTAAREVLARNRDAFLSDIREEGFATSGAEA